MGRKPFVVPEVLAHESLTGLTLQSPIDADGDGVPAGIDCDDSDASRFTPNPAAGGACFSVEPGPP
jgi:hypothetical protein